MTRINFTGRRRIPRDHVKLRVTATDGVKLYVDSLQLPNTSLPSDARVVIEAQRQTRFMRLECGTVAAPVRPSGDLLSEFDVPDGVRFRVKVVGTTGVGEGKILAAADGIVAASDQIPTGREPLLPFRPAALDQRLWKLDTTDQPTVFVNQSVGDWQQFAREPHFLAFVYPEVLRQVALWVTSNSDDAQEEDTPAAAWLRFFQELGSPPLDDAPPDQEARAEWADDWADDAADKFCRAHRFRDLISSAADEGD